MCIRDRSDEIQSAAGGIRLDTLFVDEGFGSLDEDTLNLAMKSLGDLAEGRRLVGIISHVGELKERIQHQIVVVKDKTGAVSYTHLGQGSVWPLRGQQKEHGTVCWRCYHRGP